MIKNLYHLKPVIVFVGLLIAGSFVRANPLEGLDLSSRLTLFQDSAWHNPELEAIVNSDYTIELRLTDRSNLDVMYEVLGSDFYGFVAEADSGQTYVMTDNSPDIVPGATYSYSVDAHLANGDVLQGVAVATVTIPPMDMSRWHAPELELVATSPTTIEVRITDRSELDDWYEIYNDHSPSAFFLETTDSGQTYVFVDTSSQIQPGGTYSYHVTVYLRDGSDLERVAEGSVTTPDDGTGFQNPDFTLEATSDPTTITISLTDRSDLDERYEIFGDVSSYFIENADSGQTYTFTDFGSDFVPGHTYNYVVDAFLSDGTHLQNVASGSITTPLDPPQFGPARVPYDESAINFSLLSLNPTSNNEIYRSTSPDEGFVLIASVPHSQRSFTDTGVEDDVVYYYKARAVRDEPGQQSDFTPVRRYTTNSLNYNAALSARMSGPTTVELKFTDHGINDVKYFFFNDDADFESLEMVDSGRTVTLVHENVPPGSVQTYSVTAFMEIHPDFHIDDVAVVSIEVPGATCENTGSVAWEIWRFVAGTAVTDVPVNEPPDEVVTLTKLETPQFYANEYGSRIRGYVCPPTTGVYTFYIAGDDNSDFRLSTDEGTGTLAVIASVPGHTNPRQWNKYPDQKSLPVSLEQGRRYYFEVLHKEGGGNDHVAVAWEYDGHPLNDPIDGQHLIPYEDAAAPCAGSGTIKREIWTNISGTEISEVPFNTVPDVVETYTTFETPQYYANNYGSRMRALLCVPQTGNYQIWVAGDDNTELFLSSNEDPQYANRIAFVPGHTAFRQWTKYASQHAEVFLEQGKNYYIEVRHKEGGGNDHISVGWQLPDGTLERPITGARLIEYTAPTPVACMGTGTVYREIWTGIPGHNIADIPTDTPPDRVVELNELATPNYYANEYGSRIRGYLCVPETGEYRFWITGDDDAEFWLSENQDPGSKTLVASLFRYTGYQQWDHNGAGSSGWITLVAGAQYYFEILHKEGGGADHVAVGWELPSGPFEAPIPGTHLIPFEDETAATVIQSNSAASAGGQAEIQLYPNPVTNGKVQLTFIADDDMAFDQSAVEILSFTGEVVHRQQLDCSAGCSGTMLSLAEGVRPGIYLVRIRKGDYEYSERLVIK